MKKNVSKKNWRAIFAGCVGVAAGQLTGVAGIARGDVVSTWDGTNNSWSNPAHWIPAGVPNNGNNGTNYAVVVTAGTLNLDIPITLDPMTRVVKRGERFGFGETVHIVETQKTRTGTDGEDNQTRPYRYGEFDILAVSMQPSTAKWDRYMYTLGRWLLPGRNKGEMATLQPVAMSPSEFWTDDFRTAAQWFRTEDAGKRMGDTALAARKRGAKSAARKGSSRKRK